MNDNETKISIVVPIYNLQEEIERSVKSIQRQTYKNIEIILVNDGSTDNSWEIVCSLADKDNRIISINKENEGVTSARLEGVKAATGEFIGFVDGDDEIETDMYELLLKNAKQYKADISHCGYQMIFADGRISYFHNTGYIKKQDRLTGMKDLLEGALVEPGLCNKLFHRTLFNDLLTMGEIYKSIKINEDLLMNYILFSKSNLSVFQDVCKYHYLVRKESASRGTLNEHKIFDPIYVKQYILDMKIEGMEKDANKAYIGTCVNVYNSLVLDRTTQYLQARKKVRSLLKAHKKWIPLLSKKQQILARLILNCPRGYVPIYRFYAKFLLKNDYE